MGDSVGGSPFSPQSPVQKGASSPRSEKKAGSKEDKVNEISIEIFQKLQVFEEAKAKLSAGESFAYRITKLGFDPSIPEDKAMLAELALMEAPQNEHIYYELEAYGFDPSIPEDKATLSELARIAATRYPQTFCIFSQKFGFDFSNHEDKAAFFELTKIVAASDWPISYSIQLMGFDPSNPEDKIMLFEIAAIAETSGKHDSTYHIRDYGFECNL